MLCIIKIDGDRLKIATLRSTRSFKEYFELKYKCMDMEIIVYVPMDKHSTSPGTDSFSVNTFLLLTVQESTSGKDDESNLW